MDGNNTHSGPILSLVPTSFRKLEIAFGLWSNEIIQTNSKHACLFSLVLIGSFEKHVHVHVHHFLLFPLSPEHPLLTGNCLDLLHCLGRVVVHPPGMQIGCSHVDPGLDLC